MTAAPEVRREDAGEAPAVRRVRWSQACRIVPTRYPAISIYDRVADADDFDALYALEAMTNERVRNEAGDIERVPRDERLFGPGSGPIMAAFTHVNTLGSRFSDGGYGVFYAARERATAVAETRHHHGHFLAATKQAAMHLPMRLYHVQVDARLHEAGSAGVVYRSVRHARGQCVGLFRPRGASRCLHAAYLLYAWDGERFTDVYEKTE